MPLTPRPTSALTDRQKLVEAFWLDLWGTPSLSEYVAELRGNGRSWRSVADRVNACMLDDKDGHLTVTYETLRTWYGE